MPRLSSIHRIVFGLVGLSVSVLLVSGLLGFVPNVRPVEQQARASFCESTALTFMTLAPRMTAASLQETLDGIAARNPAVVSIGIRRSSGELVLDCGHHAGHWVHGESVADNEVRFVLPIDADETPWGQMEVYFLPLSGVSIFGWYARPDFLLVVFVSCALFAAFSVYLQKVLKHLSPGKVVPNRVREALNSLAEGLLVLDRNQRIVLANSSFASCTGMDADDLIGLHPQRLGFRGGADGDATELPWDTTTRQSRPVQGALLTYGTDENERMFSVSTVPVRDERNQSRGVVASFEDVTSLHRKQQELREALRSLRASADEIRTQNRELEWLATRDTLTGFLNRRSFFKTYEAEWAKTRQRPQVLLAAIMVDIDHFKTINDSFGHSTGDEVLRQVAAAVMRTVDDNDVLCRYGGEEFILLLPGSSLDDAELKAEKCRLAIKSLQIGDLRVTASLGVSAICQAPENPQALLDQADKSMYAAKRSGRNRVLRWDRAQAIIQDVSDANCAAVEKEADSDQDASAIHFHAVAALTTVLAHRDQAAAVHSRRVADLCVATAEGLLSMKQCYVLEIAALLHDIGKIGIPDNLLKKPGPLTADERQVVSQYNRLSVEIVRGSFGQPVLNEIVEQQVVWYDMSNAARGAGPDQRPSLSARILSIANAYDTMLSDTTWRKSMTRSEAFAELRRCSGTQFDPELVERFIGAVQVRSGSQSLESNASREAALSIGLLLERLVNTLDNQDLEELSQLTSRIQTTAEDHSLTNIADLCRILIEALTDNQDLIEVMHLAGELLDLCRSTQSRLLSAETALQLRPKDESVDASSLGCAGIAAPAGPAENVAQPSLA